MPNELVERPQFFEGQYLGAKDLSAAVDYGREQRARHALGAHTWGIAAGLQLITQESPAGGGQVEMYIQPGYAWDGYGRAVAVLSPYRIPEALFATQSSGSIKVWLRYDEVEAQADPFGNGQCNGTDQYRRVEETFILEIGEKSAIVDRQDGISLAGLDVNDAREALIQFEDNAPLICDASIPFQALPTLDENPRWLIPLGVVKWVAGSPGYFTALEEAEHKETRQLRRYAGVVAEGIQAADGVIRLRDRTTDAVTGEARDTTCATDRLQDSDLTYSNDTVGVNDLVWVEGNLRVEGNARLFGTRLEFLTDKGEDDAVPLFLRRDTSDTGQDLQIVIGDEAKATGANRLAIGTVNLGTDSDGNTIYKAISEKLIIKDDGKVGIGTNVPENYLSSANHLVIAADSATGLTVASGDSDTGELLFADGDTGNARQAGIIRYDHSKDNLSFGTLGEERLFINNAGNVGLGTSDPATALHIKGNDPDLFLDIDSSSANNWTELRFGKDGTIASKIYWSKLDNKTYFQNQGTNAMIMDGGKVGIGATSPEEMLHIKGEDPDLKLDINSTSSNALAEMQFALDGVVKSKIYWNRVNNNTYLQNAGTDTMVLSGANVGIGATVPSQRLEVRGNIAMGPSGDLFAVGGVLNLRLVTGSITSTGGYTANQGHTASRTGTGVYHVAFTSAFPNVPVVVVTLNAPLADDNVINVKNVSASGFDVVVRDINDSGGGTSAQDSAFNFVAFGTR